MRSRRQIDRELDRLLGSFEHMLKRVGVEQELKPPTNFVLTKQEESAWKKNEVDFTKRIVTPLDGNPRQTRRYQNQTSQCLNEPLNACDRNRNQEPL